VLSIMAFSSAAQASAATVSAPAARATARIQHLLDHPVAGTVNLPSGQFTITPTLRLSQGERIVGHHTTLRVASGSGSYRAVLAGTSNTTDLSGLAITGVTFDQNAAGNPARSAASLLRMPRFVILAVTGTGITIAHDRFVNCDDMNTIVTGGATRTVTIKNDYFSTRNPLMHDHSTVYTSGTGTVISGNTFVGRAMLDSAAVEVHGSQVLVTGNRISGYYRGANIVAPGTTFTRNHIAAAASPVELWSFPPAALRNVIVSGNVLGQHLAYWRGQLARRGLHLPPRADLRPVFRNPTSPLPFSNITVRGNTR